MKKLYATILLSVFGLAAWAQDEIQRPVFETPEGEYVVYERASDTYTYVSGVIYKGYSTGFAGQVVYAEDDVVWFKNMISSYVENSWLKAKKVGDQIVMDLPQPYYIEYYDDGYGLEEDIWPVKRVIWNDMMETYFEDPDNQQIVFDVLEDGSIKMVDDGALLGICTNGGVWMGDADWNYVFTPFNEQPMDAPEGIETKPFAFSYEYDTYLCQAAIEGNDIYVKGIYAPLPDAWIKGTIDGDKALFPSGQFLGVDNSSSCLAYFLGTSMGILEVDGKQYDAYVRSENYVMEYDAEKQSMKNYNHDDCLMINAGNGPVNYINYLYDTMLVPQPEEVTLPPAKPWFVDVTDFAYDYMQGMDAWYAQFCIPKMDIEGHYLNPENMYYLFEIDGEVYTFYADEYNLKYDATDIPYYYADGFNVFVQGIRHQVYFYFDGYESLGIRSIYEKEDGTVLMSDVAYWQSGKVSDLDAADVLSKEYYDLTGARIQNPDKGIYIEVATKKDGSRVSNKTLKY